MQERYRAGQGSNNYRPAEHALSAGTARPLLRNSPAAHRHKRVQCFGAVLVVAIVGAAIGRPRSTTCVFAEIPCGNEGSTAGRAMLAPTVME